MSIKNTNNIRSLFPWFKYCSGHVYADNGATTLKPKCVIDSVVTYYSTLGTNSHNTDSEFSYQTTKKISECRSLLAKLINAEIEEVCFTSGATESLNLFANGLKPYFKNTDNIVLTLAEHSSNILPWMNMIANKKQLRYAKFDENSIIQSINKKTKILSIANVSNLFGLQLDLKKIINAARKINKDIVIVVDATQGIAHHKIDVSALKIDFLACSAHKMCGPTGIGMAFISKKWLHKINPIRLGGGMNNHIKLATFTYASAPEKFEGGTPNIAGIIGWAQAIKFLNEFGWDKIAKIDQSLCSYIKQKLATIENIKIINPTTKLPIIGFTLKGVHSQDLANYLGRNKIIVRSGLSCAKLTPHITQQEHVVRASFYFYNTFKDIDILIDALKKFKQKDIVYGI